MDGMKIGVKEEELVSLTNVIRSDMEWEIVLDMKGKRSVGLESRDQDRGQDQGLSLTEACLELACFLISAYPSSRFSSSSNRGPNAP